MAKISKLESARSQLSCAIRLYFNEDDLVSAITLSRAAWRVLYDIYPTLSEDGFKSEIDSMFGGGKWRSFNKIANDLKHADRDPTALIEPTPTHAMVGIGFAVILYVRVGQEPTDEIWAWNILMTIIEAKDFGIKDSPELEGYEDYMKAIEY